MDDSESVYPEKRMVLGFIQFYTIRSRVVPRGSVKGFSIHIWHKQGLEDFLMEKLVLSFLYKFSADFATILGGLDVRLTKMRRASSRFAVLSP